MLNLYGTDEEKSLGLNVIPTIEWGDERSFDFCFDGVEEGSIVAVSTYGKQKIEAEFMLGDNEMLRRIKPCAIICYEKPFPRMKEKIKVFPETGSIIVFEDVYFKYLKKYLNNENISNKNYFDCIKSLLNSMMIML